MGRMGSVRARLLLTALPQARRIGDEARENVIEHRLQPARGRIAPPCADVQMLLVLDLEEELSCGLVVPIGYPMTVRPMKAGAIEFLTKPFRDQSLLVAIEAGLARDRARRESEKALDELRI